MVTAKELLGTYPHQQMRAYLKGKFPQDTPKQHGARLSALVKKWLHNYHNELNGWWRLLDDNGVPRDIDNSFTWGGTPEGHEFWANIHRLELPRPMPMAKKVKDKPRKKVGWWA